MSTTESDEDLPDIKKLIYSQINVIRFDYTWTLSFESDNLFDSNFKCVSPIFSPRGNEKVKLYLKMTAPSGPNLQIPIYICLMSCNISHMRMTSKLSLCIPNTCFCTSVTSTYKCVSSTTTQEFKVPHRVTDSEIKAFMKTGNIRMICEIELVENDFHMQRNISVIEVPECRLLDNMRHLFESQELSDVMIDICGQQLPAHKAILSVNSRVFSAMFKNKMSEKQLNRVDVTDVELEVFKEMLRYIYTCEVPNIEKIADKLLMVAEKYELMRLKLMCEETLRANLTVENVSDTLILADLHHADQLKAHAIDFIVINMMQVVELANFKSMLDSHPYLIPDILRATARRINALIALTSSVCD